MADESKVNPPTSTAECPCCTQEVGLQEGEWVSCPNCGTVKAILEVRWRLIEEATDGKR